MMMRALETFFLHKIIVLIPLAVAVVACAGYVLMQPSTYSTTARVWVPGQGYGTTTAADLQVSTINELLKSKTFCAQVGTRGPLAQYMASNGSSGGGLAKIPGVRRLLGGGSGRPPSDDQLLATVSSMVTVVAAQPQGVVITVTGPNADVAQGTARAVISVLLEQEVTIKTGPLKAQVDHYQQQAKTQAETVQAISKSMNDWIATHPQAAARPDSQTQLLQQQLDEAQQSYKQLLAKADQAKSDLNLQQASQPFMVMDTPGAAGRTSSLSKSVLAALGGGLLAGLVASLLVLVGLIRLDGSVRRMQEVRPLLGLTPVGTIPLAPTLIPEQSR